MSNKTLEEKKQELLKEAFENRKSFIDPFGRKVTMENAEVDHILPKSKNGSDKFDNLEVISRKSNQEKSDNLSGIMTNGIKYKVKTKRRDKTVGKLVVKKTK